MQIAGPAASRADGKLSSYMRLGTSREGCDLLMANMDPLDLASPADRVRQTVETVSDYAVDSLDACRFQRGHEEIGYVVDGHDLFPQ